MTKSAQISPVPHSGTNGLIKDGWGGKQDLPVTRIEGGYATAWVPSNAAMKILRSGGALSLVVTFGSEGLPQISMEAVAVKLT